ncbi:multidrug efflux SMR transporter [bacterium]|jgi:quaternary ammonium compound-resistance protein SugE|nr:multidrug efflux SMR transporter [bacterium]
MAWVLVVLAGLVEIVFAVSMKQSHGFTRLWWTVLLCASGALSFGLLAYAVKTLPVGVAYAVWTGLGAAGTVAVGIWAFNESANAGKLLSIGLVLIGIVGLRLYEH